MTTGKTMKTFGSLLKQMREKRGIGLRELARKMQMDAGFLSKLENNNAIPPNNSFKILKYSRALDLYASEQEQLIEAALSYHTERLKKGFI